MGRKQARTENENEGSSFKFDPTRSIFTDRVDEQVSRRRRKAKGREERDEKYGASGQFDALRNELIKELTLFLGNYTFRRDFSK